ncbi:Interleukin-22 receptor subunit alpha-2 [Channa argus]|uniref:Interleukin-22 receptor subunit alpha-2 n=1 Tax=Channa argus TaxID=215402 RepID=A0A6G1PPU6_CHAAH|nr:Interleukin-22 receptor subunit alpha-2 [Channa argus]
MKMWSMRVSLLLLVCYACLALNCNARVYFVSKNFNNILHWDPVKTATPEEKVLYSVWYKSDTMDKFQLKEECHNITALSCDLTAETPSVYDIQYKALVLINGSSHGLSLRFKPLAETILGPPKLSISTTVLLLHVKVTLPLGPNGVSIADIINGSTKGPNQGAIIYTLKITEPKSAALEEKKTTGQFVIDLKSKLSLYCGYVVYVPLSESGRSQSQNASFCVTVPADHRMLVPWLLIGAAFLAAIIIMSVLYTYNYVKGGKQNSMPQSLVTATGTLNKVLQPQDRKLSISKPELCTPTKTSYATIQPSVKPNLLSITNGGYSPQDVTLQAWTGSSVGTDEHSPNPITLDSSSQSEIYSVVVINRENKDFQQVTTKNTNSSNVASSSSSSSSSSHRESSDKGEMSRIPATLHDLDATESDQGRPLLLHTERNPSGQLMLSLLFPPLQSSTNTGPSPLTSERKPLLSDLIDTKAGPSLASLLSFDSSEWSDSGCDDTTVDTPTIYSPSLTAVPDFHQGCLDTPATEAAFESGYKQNWMSEILVEAGGNNSCIYKRTNYL